MFHPSKVLFPTILSEVWTQINLCQNKHLNFRSMIHFRAFSKIGRPQFLPPTGSQGETRTCALRWKRISRSTGPPLKNRGLGRFINEVEDNVIITGKFCFIFIVYTQFYCLWAIHFLPDVTVFLSLSNFCGALVSRTSKFGSFPRKA